MKKPRGHYCKICGEYKTNEKFSGKGHANHICKACASLPVEQRNERMTITRLENLPWWLSKENLKWLRKKMNDRNENIRDAAVMQYELRFSPKQMVAEADDSSWDEFELFEGLIGMVYACDACKYLFEAENEVDQCPDCGKHSVRQATPDEIDEYITLRQEIEEW